MNIKIAKTNYKLLVITDNSVTSNHKNFILNNYIKKK